MIDTRAIGATCRVLALVALCNLAVGGWAGPAPASASLPPAGVQVLRPAISRWLGDPPVLRVDAVPDRYVGGYARISVYAKDADADGMRIDQVWIRLLGASFDPAQLRRGVMRVLSVRESSVYTRVTFASLEDFLNRQSPMKHVKVAAADHSIAAEGVVSRNWVAIPVRVHGVFAVNGTPELFFRIKTLTVNSVPASTVQIGELDRRINPVIDFRTWPVRFPIRVFRQTGDEFILSSRTIDAH